MLQLLDLARENAALTKDLERIREEAEALRLLLTARDAGDLGDRAPAADQTSGSCSPPCAPLGASLHAPEFLVQLADRLRCPFGHAPSHMSM